jgi:queuine tRNA-ribosyltransferase
MLGPMLLTGHNLHYYQDLTSGLRTAIEDGALDPFAAAFEADWQMGDMEPVLSGSHD